MQTHRSIQRASTLSLALAATVAFGGPDLIFEDGFECGAFIIFCDGFESGDTSAWSTTVPIPPPRGSSFLDVNNAAALLGSFGLEVAVGSGSAYVSDTTPAGETVYRANFLFSANSLVLNEGEEIVVFNGIRSGSGSILEIAVRGTSSGLSAVARAREDDTVTWRETMPTALPTGTVSIGAEMVSANSVASADGQVRLFRDGVAQDAITDVDNFNQIVDTARLGLVFDLGVGSGSIYLDDFRSFRIAATP